MRLPFLRRLPLLPSRAVAPARTSSCARRRSAPLRPALRLLALLWPLLLSQPLPLRAETAVALQPAEPAAAPALLLARSTRADLDPAPYLVSEKLDGVRAYWDGRRLRFRSGAEVRAPAWFLARLPAQALDGELWLGRGRFEALSGLVRRTEPQDADWQQISYRIFELPGAPGSFAERAARIEALVAQTGWAQLAAVPQQRLRDATALQARLDEVLRAGGEGLVLHLAEAPYLTGRSDVLLKLKPREDAEGVVMAHLPGKGRHAGRLGALQLRLADGRLLRIGTGFSDAERADPPPLGSVVSFSFEGRTRTGLPRFARYLRRHDGF